MWNKSGDIDGVKGATNINECSDKELLQQLRLLAYIIYNIGITLKYYEELW